MSRELKAYLYTKHILTYKDGMYKNFKKNMKKGTGKKLLELESCSISTGRDFYQWLLPYTTQLREHFHVIKPKEKYQG